MIDFDFRKWGGRPHWRFGADLLGADEHGSWFHVPENTAYTGPRGAGKWPIAFLLLVPDDDWWAAAWNLGGDIDLYVDIATPAQWLTDDHLTLVDLDLDVVRMRDGTLTLDDEDEFEEHRVLYSYPDDVVERARKTSQALMQHVGEGRAPFGPVPESWLSAVPS